MSELENPFLEVAHRIEVVENLLATHKTAGFQLCIDVKTGEIVFLVENEEHLTSQVRAKALEIALWS